MLSSKLHKTPELAFGTPKWVLIGRIDLVCGPTTEKWPCQKAEKPLQGTCNPGPGALN